MLPLRSLLLSCAIAISTSLFPLPSAQAAPEVDTITRHEFNTANFHVSIRSDCPEGTVVCDRIQYQGTNLTTGDAITLQGSTLHRLCGDGITPCQFLGYEFRNGQYRYVVTDSNELIVYQGERVILSEQAISSDAHEGEHGC